jgi:DNA polymerase-3 subunit epsilon
MDFVVVDVETANAHLSSICQIGIASFNNGSLADSWESLVNPEDYFSSVNVSIHGIDEHHVQDAPTWRDIFPQVTSRLQNRIVVSHTLFDRGAVASTCGRYGLTECECNWLDSSRVVRMAWPQFSKSGYGLSNVAAQFGIEYRAHNALEDARCAGLLLLRAIAETGLSATQWLSRIQQPIHSSSREHPFSDWPSSCKRDGNPEGEFFGEILVFTGSLSVSRQEAADIAAIAGCRVDDGVTKHTTMLIVGDQDLRMLAGRQKSSKHMKAEQLIAKGQHIRILGESDFVRILSPK